MSDPNERQVKAAAKRARVAERRLCERGYGGWRSPKPGDPVWRTR